MYLHHFGLREMPFSLTPDAGFVFRSRAYQAALNTVLLAVDTGEGFVKVTGEVGTGKTMLGRELLALLEARFSTAYVPHPALDPRQMACALASELGIGAPSRSGAARLHAALQSRLLKLAGQQRPTVIVVDEAHALPTETLEYLRLLSNLETSKRKLIQLVLLGQPELDARLHGSALRALASRIAFAEQLQPMDRATTSQYLAHRLHAAGWNAPSPWSDAAVWWLHRGSGGVPRRVNRIAHKALMLAYGEGRWRIGWLAMRRAAADDAATVGPARLAWGGAR